MHASGSDHSHDHAHPHTHPDDHDEAHEGERRSVPVQQAILAKNDRLAERNRGYYTVHKATDEDPLIIPEEAVIVAGSRAITHGRVAESL